jgi:hypothetical protein
MNAGVSQEKYVSSFILSTRGCIVFGHNNINATIVQNINIFIYIFIGGLLYNKSVIVDVIL